MRDVASRAVGAELALEPVTAQSLGWRRGGSRPCQFGTHAGGDPHRDVAALRPALPSLLVVRSPCANSYDVTFALLRIVTSAYPRLARQHLPPLLYLPFFRFGHRSFDHFVPLPPNWCVPLLV